MTEFSKHHVMSRPCLDNTNPSSSVRTRIISTNAIARIMARPQLLQLPAEIRLKILELLLGRSDPLTSGPVPCPQCADVVPQVGLDTHLFEHKAQKKTLDLYTAILRTCKQLHNEGTPILYAKSAAAKVWLEDDPMGPWLRHERGRYQRLSLGPAQYGVGRGSNQ